MSSANLNDPVFAFLVLNSVISAISLYVTLRLFVERFVTGKKIKKERETVISLYRLLIFSVLLLTSSIIFKISSDPLFAGFFELLALSTFLIVVKRTWKEIE